LFFSAQSEYGSTSQQKLRQQKGETVMPQREIRPARAEDREPVLAFCTETWEWGDYIERVWDKWLYDPNGRLFVATVDERPVGMSHMRMLDNTEVWLEGVRVDPAYRRMGLAIALNRAMLLEAMRHGATVARLTVDAQNTDSIQFFEHRHMRRVGAFAPYTAPPLIASSQSVPSRIRHNWQHLTIWMKSLII
jgi:ribosomal protein S18 acetylase RimI-like enzyme